MDKKKCFIILTLLVLPIVYAQPQLVATPNNFSVSGISGDTLTFSILLQNNGTVPIHNISFSSLNEYTFPTLQTLSINDQNTSVITTHITIPTTNTVISTISFFFTENISGSQNNHTINILNDSYEPTHTTLRQGDTVIWHNTDTVNHTVIALDGSFTLLVQPGMKASKTFFTIQEIIFYDVLFPNAGTLTILTNQSGQSVHNSQFDVPITFFQNIVPIENATKITFFDENITVRHDQTFESALLLENQANTTIHNITLNDTLNWMNFTQNQFDLPALTTKVVVFTIKPNITSTSETNKTYTNTIKINSQNTPEITRQLDINIPHANVNISINNTLQDLLNFFNIGKLEELLAVLKMLNQTNNETIIILQANDTLEITVSKEKLNEMLEQFSTLQGQAGRVFNDLTTTDQYIQTIEQELNKTNTQLDTLSTQNDKNKDMMNALFIVGIFSLLGFGGNFIIKKYVYKHKNEPLIGPQTGGEKDVFDNT